MIVFSSVFRYTRFLLETKITLSIWKCESVSWLDFQEWQFFLRYYYNALRGQKYVDIAETLFTNLLLNSLHSSDFSLSSRCWTCCRDLLHSYTRASVRSTDVDVGWSGLAHAWWGWGQSSVQASQPLPHQTGKNIFLWRYFCAHGHCQDETGKGQTQTVDTKLETR